MPLMGLLAANSVFVHASPHIIRGALKVVAYQYKLIHKPGKDLQLADALSRFPLPVSSKQIATPADICMVK